MTDEFEPKGNQEDVIEATDRALVVEAVAGSGKTTTMVERIRYAIDERGVAPDRLLVLTFANEAAHTIRAKLRDAIGPADAFAVDVYTYHSFSYSLLREYAYPLGLSPDFELITDEDRPQLIESVVDEVDRSFVVPNVAATSGVDEQVLGTLTDFIESMRRHGVSPEAVEAYLPDDETLRTLLTLVEDFREMAHDLVDIDANDLWKKNEKLATRCDRLAIVYRAKADTFVGDNQVERAVAGHLQAMAETAEAVANHLRTTADLDWRCYRIPEALFADERNMFSSVAQTPFGRLAAFAEMLRTARACTGAYTAYLEALDERGAFDYDELIHRANDLLRDDTIGDDVLSEWEAVYCDEFQDTDEAQLGLIEQLRTDLDILVVGDSDQAIHEWRGQDPQNMAKLPDSFESIDLALNFRSRQPILDLATGIDPAKNRIEAYRDPSPPNVFKIDSSNESTPEQVSTTISHLLTGRFEDVPARALSDIAVLARSNKHVREIAAQLEDDSIPHTVSGDITDEVGQGVRTVLAYFRILVTPADDVSWQRVLLHLYRIPETDIDAVRSAGETIPDGYNAISKSTLSAPDRFATAMTEYHTLRGVATTHSISELYRHLKRESNVEWFLREVDRDSLQQLERLVTSFSDSPVESRLTPAFVDYLDRQAHLLSSSGETATSVGSRSTDAVDVMTVHQAKGLDFDTVLVPYLTPAEFGWSYQESLYQYDVLVDGIDGTAPDPLCGDWSDSQIAEEWRILHVALTRAKDHLFVFGNDVTDDDPTAAMIDDLLPGARSDTPIEWAAAGPEFNPWEAIEDSYETLAETTPEAVRDYTEVVNRGVDEDPGTITYYHQELTTERAIETVLGFADQVVAGTLADDETDTSAFMNAPLGTPFEVALARTHSHSALESVRDCERKHVLDYVLGAFPDPQPGGREAGMQAAIGTLFHDVAELAYWRGYDTIEEWDAACRWLARRHDRDDLLEPALACIRRYFDLDVCEWPVVGAEVPIDLTVEGIDGSVTGFIDAVAVHPDGGLAVLDYKTSRARKSIDESHQLQLYVRACEERFERPITHAGYVYVGEAGPARQLFPATELADRWEELLEDLRAADTSTFGTATPGEHCRFCAHRSLGCADASTAYDDPFVTE